MWSNRSNRKHTWAVFALCLAIPAGAFPSGESWSSSEPNPLGLDDPEIDDPKSDSAKTDDADPADSFSALVQPFLETHCVECHDAFAPAADLDLESLQLSQFEEAAREPDLARLLFDRVQSGQMPPSTRPRPNKNELGEILDWLASMADRQESPRPIRRMNTEEFQNTVRDLFFVEFNSREHFPQDEIGNRFDTLGHSLSMSPYLFESLVNAAETIAHLAVPTPEESWPRQVKTAVDIIDRGRKLKIHRKARVLPTNEKVTTRLAIHQPGTYEFRIFASADQAGEEPVKMKAHINKQAVDTFEIHSHRKTESLQTRIELDAGEVVFGASFINDFFDEELPENRRDRNLAIHRFEIIGPIDRPHLTDFQRQIEQWSLELDHQWEAVVTRLLTRAFRAPPSTDEVSRILAFSTHPDPIERLRLTVSATIASPKFIYRFEENGETSGDYALASRLSYFLWSSLPDAPLMELAKDGTLSEDATLRAQVQRMLEHPHADALVTRFSKQWLGLGILDDHEPDPRLYPEFDAPLKEAMRRETERFVESVFRENRPLHDLLSADYTFVNERLAKHYGLPGVKGSHHRRVSLSASPRRGLLTQGAILTMTSEPTRTSPVKRGQWILSTLLGSPPPPPPPEVEGLDQASQDLRGKSIREQMEIHAADPGCYACHASMDPLGFALEHFDPIGQYRERDRGHEIDAEGVLPDGREFTGSAELVEILTSDRTFVFTLSRQLMIYALGQELSLGTQTRLRRWLENQSPHTLRFQDLVTQIVLSPSFRTTRHTRMKSEEER